MNHRLGMMLRGLAVLHGAVGLVIYRRPLASVVGDGLVNAFDPHIDRRAAFWFLLFTPVLFMTAQLVDAAARRGDSDTLRTLARNFLGIGALGAAAMPVSGFWFVLGLGALMLRSASALERDALP